MCLIIETRKSIHIPKVVMEDMYKRNDDGYGFMYLRNGHVIGEKFHDKTIDELYDKYEELREFEPYIHLRMMTHGDVNTEQAHPFYCGHGIWLMHNGILSNTQGDDKTKSDTWYLANEYLKPIFDHAKDADTLLGVPAFQDLVTRFIGGGNRIVLMAKKSGSWRYNSSSWHTIDNVETNCVGMRVSNTYAWSMHTKKYEQPKVYETNRYTGKYGGTYERKTYSEPESKVVVPPNFKKSESKPDDPAGSFRDEQGELWIYNGSGWVKYDHYKALWPNAPKTIYTTFGGSGEVSLAHPTFPKVAESDLSKSGTVLVNEKSSESLEKEQKNMPREVKKVPSFIDAENDEVGDEDAQTEAEYNMDLYQDWLFDEWKSCPYGELAAKIKDDMEGAVDVIAFALAIKMDFENGV